MSIDEEKKYSRYRENPTIEGVFSTLHDGEGQVVITTHVDTGDGVERVNKKVQRKVDNRNFIKLFRINGTLDKFTELTRSAQMLLVYVMEKMDMNDTYTYVYGNEFCDKTHLSRGTFSNALTELLDKKWIYKSNIPKKYWINLYLIAKNRIEKLYYKHLSEKGI